VRYDSLPNRAFPGDPDATPAATTSSPTCTDYARDFELPLELKQDGSTPCAAARTATEGAFGRFRLHDPRS
jgi:hypothetical protein